MDYATSDAKRPLGRFAAALARPLGWPTHTLAVVALLWVCWDTRFPGGGLAGSSLGALVVWAWVLLVWLTRPVTGLVIRLWSRQPLGPLLAGWRHWCIAPLLLGVSYAAIEYALPSRVAFWISRPAMDRLAQSIMVDGNERSQQWVGVIPISRAGRIKGGVQLDYGRKELPWGQRGLYFSVDGTAIKNSYYYSQQPLEGGWHMWHYGGW